MPTVLSIVRLLVLVAVVIAIAQAWAFVDFIDWAASATGMRILSALISAALIVVGGFVIYVTVSSWIECRLNPEVGRIPSSRERTLLSLLRNAFTIVLAVMVGMLALRESGVNIAPLLAGAGVIGVAVGFGAQKLVQDVITGIFNQLENAINEGDVVPAGGVSGVVERLTSRFVAMRDLRGVYHIVPFSAVDKVSNMMRHFAYHVADIGVAYRERIPEVKEAVHTAFERLAAGPEGASVIGLLDMWGVNELGDSAVVVRARIKTLPGKQWAVGRAYNESVKEVFDERGIEIPFPHITIWAGEDKDGSAPPLRLARAG